MKSQALIRVDGGKHIGLGHVVRCLNFAEFLRKYHVEALFVTRAYGRKIPELIRQHNFAIKMINKNANFKDDAIQTRRIAESSHARFIFTDLSTEENLAKKKEFTIFFKTLKTPGLFLVSVDDFKKIDFPFDIQIIPYCGAEDIQYKFFQHTNALLGAKYYIAAPSDVKLAQKKRGIQKNAKRILITIGGSDPTYLTLDIAKALMKLNNKHLEVKIIIGACFSNMMKMQIKNILRNFKGAYESCPPRNIIKLMLWSDLVISGTGLTRYEAALTGTPNLCVTRSKINTLRIRKFIAAGTSRHISLAEKNFAPHARESIKQLLENFTLRKKMHQSGKRLLDGKGADRIIAELRKRKII